MRILSSINNKIYLQPLAYTYLLFIISFLYLGSLLIDRSLEMTSLTNGFFAIPSTNKTILPEYVKNCNGIWTCGKTICEMYELQQINPTWLYYRMIIYEQEIASCSNNIWFWLLKYNYSKISLITLIVACGICLLSLLPIILVSYKTKYKSLLTISLIMRILTYINLVISYIFYYIWIYHTNISLGDPQPKLMFYWNMALSIILLFINFWSLFPDHYINISYSEL